MGFHPRASVLGVAARGVDGAMQTYDKERVRRRSEILGYAIDARRQRFPDERQFSYRPHAQSGETFCWSEESRANIRDYQIGDMLI